MYDAAQSLPGRGAYLHREWACVRGFGVEGLGLGRGTQRPKTFRRKLAQLARAFKVSEGELLADAGSDAFAVLVQELEEQVTIDEGEQATGKAPVDQTRRIKTRFF